MFDGIAFRLGLIRDIDSSAYLAMADGRWSEVLRPFSNRVLGPLLAQQVGFPVVQAAAAVLFALAVAYLFRRMRVSPLWALPFLLAPWLVSFCLNLYMPDLLASALTALCLALYAWKGPFAAAPALLPMMMARESSIVVAFVWLTLLVRDVIRGRRRGRALAVAACVIAFVALGQGLVKAVSADSPGTLTGMGGLYLPVKAIVSLLYSVAGVKPWNDVYAAQLPQFYTHAPIWKMACPELLRVGRFTEIGIYEWHPFQFLVTLKILLVEFGVVVPYAICRFRDMRERFGQAEDWLKLAAGAGVLFWLLTPLCSFSPYRYIGYAWPCFWLLVVPSAVAEGRRRRRFLLGAHALLFVCSLFF